MELRTPDPTIVWDGGHLRQWTLDDAPALVRAWNDRDVARWNPVPASVTMRTAEHWIGGCDRRVASGAALDLCIVADHPGGEVVVGEVGLAGFDAERRGAQIGYWLLPEARGSGHASRAVSSLADWALGDLDLAMLVARCHEQNVASHAVAERSGFERAGADNTGHILWVRRAS